MSYSLQLYRPHSAHCLLWLAQAPSPVDAYRSLLSVACGSTAPDCACAFCSRASTLVTRSKRTSTYLLVLRNVFNPECAFTGVCEAPLPAGARVCTHVVRIACIRIRRRWRRQFRGWQRVPKAGNREPGRQMMASLACKHTMQLAPWYFLRPVHAASAVSSRCEIVQSGRLLPRRCSRCSAS